MRTLVDAIDLVTPFTSNDETRPHLCKPARWPAHVVATDGHTLAAARYDDETPSAATLARVLDCKGDVAVPPWRHVVPQRPTLSGEWLPNGTPQLPFFPAAWVVGIEIGGAEPATMTGYVPARTGKHGKVLRPTIKMFDKQPIPGFEDLRVPFRVALNAFYLHRIVELFRPMFPIFVHAGPDALSPVTFANDTSTKKDITEVANLIAVIMPMRI